jgi:excisionase family DNA binding protein
MCRNYIRPVQVRLHYHPRMSTTHAPAHDYLTVREVAAELRIHPNTIRIWLREGFLHGFIVNDRAGWRVERSELDAFIAEAQQHPGQVDDDQPSDAAAAA